MFADLAKAVALGVVLVAPHWALAQSALEPQVEQAIKAARERATTEDAAARDWGRLAMVQQAHGLLEAAYSAYVEAMRRDPSDYRWPFLAAACDRDSDVALGHLRDAYALETNDAALSQSYADALTRAGDLSEARTVYQRAAGQVATAELAQLGLARLALLDGKINESLDQLRLLTDQGSRNGDVYRLLAQVLRRDGNHSDAKRAAEMALELGHGRQPISPVFDAMRAHARSPGVLIDTGYRSMARFELDSAAKSFEAALEWDRSGAARLALGQLALEQGDVHQAVHHLERSREVGPDAPDLVAATRDALEYSERAHRLRRRDAATTYLLSRAYALNGQFDDAVQTARRARELALGNEELLTAIDERLREWERER